MHAATNGAADDEEQGKLCDLSDHAGHATDTDDEGEMADADNGMAKARQQTLPHRDGHFATQMVGTGSRCEIGAPASERRSPNFFRAGRHGLPPSPCCQTAASLPPRRTRGADLRAN